MAKTRRKKTRRPTADALAELALGGARRASELAERKMAAERKTSSIALAAEAEQQSAVRVTLNLSRAVVKRLKHAAIDTGLTASKLAEQILRQHLQLPEQPADKPSPADERIHRAVEFARQLREQGVSLRETAERMNARGFTTEKGSAWQWHSVRRYLDR